VGFVWDVWLVWWVVFWRGDLRLGWRGVGVEQTFIAMRRTAGC